jgi:hypothetical protein
MELVEQTILDKSYHTLLSIIKGFRNGAVYGAKIRFPHALVMTFLFRSGRYEEVIPSSSINRTLFPFTSFFLLSISYPFISHPSFLAFFLSLFLPLSSSLRQKWDDIFQATYTHSKNLAVFVFIYKSLMALQKSLNGGHELSSHSFWSGLIGGYFVFGKYSNVNYQVLLLLLIRLLFFLHLSPLSLLHSSSCLFPPHLFLSFFFRSFSTSFHGLRLD